MLDRKRFIADLREIATKRVRFLHQGCSEGGMDCINLPKWAYQQQGLFLPPELNEAFTAYYRVPDGVRLQKEMEQHLIEVKLGEARAGDVYLFRVRRNTQHVAVRVTDDDPPLMVQALKQGVREIPLDDQWKARIVTVFRIPDEF